MVGLSAEREEEEGIAVFGYRSTEHKRVGRGGIEEKRRMGKMVGEGCVHAASVLPGQRLAFALGLAWRVVRGWL